MTARWLTAHININTFIALEILAAIAALFFYTPADESTTLRVMSYNIAAGHGDIHNIANTIKEQNPDIVALQEADVHWSERSNYMDQVSYLGEALNMHSFFAEIYKLESENADKPYRQFGLAFLSKKPFEFRQNHHLTRLSSQAGTADRQPFPGFPEVLVEVNGQNIHLFNTHLDYRPDPYVRSVQVEEMIKIIEPANRPTILMGDLNARPESREIHPLFRLLNDAWKNGADPGFTYPADQPDRRIDYILHTDHFEVKNIFVVKTEASDHRPVVADLVIRSDFPATQQIRQQPFRGD